MTKIKTLLALALLLAVTTAANAGIKVIGTLPNGDKVVRIKTFGLFCPSTTTVITVKADGDVQTLNQAGGPGLVPAVANAGGLVGAATQLRPARSNTSVTASPSTSVNAGNPNTTVNVPVTPGPTTINNGGSHNHHNGN